MEEVKTTKRRLVKSQDKAAEKPAEKSPRKSRKSPQPEKTTDTKAEKPKRSPRKTEKAEKTEQVSEPKSARTSKKAKQAVQASTVAVESDTSSTDSQTGQVATEQAPARRSRAKTEPKPKKPKALPEVKPTYIDKQGISMSMARVKHVLLTCALNEEEYYAKQQLYKAEHGPTKPRPSKDNPNPEVVPHVPVHIQDISDPVVHRVLAESQRLSDATLQSRFVNEVYGELRDNDKFEAFDTQRSEAAKKAKAEGREFNAFEYLVSTNHKYKQQFAAFKAELVEKRRREEYEQDVYNKMSDEEGAKYMAAKKAERERLREEFDSQTFNTNYNKAFYAGLANFKSPATEWSDAHEAINKLLTRVAADTKVVLSAFLDQLVLQFMTNGLHQTLLENKKTLQIHNMLTVPADSGVLTLDRFARTLSSYESARRFLFETDNARKKQQEEKTKMPKVEYPLLNKDESKKFGNYIMDLFRHARNNLALQAKASSQEVHDNYLQINISKEVKNLCSNFVYETIVRIGHAIKHNITSGSTKTVSAQVMRDTIANMLILCGVPVHSVCGQVNQAVDNYKQLRQKKNETKQ